jgi:hypothetical protein
MQNPLERPQAASTICLPAARERAHPALSLAELAEARATSPQAAVPSAPYVGTL